LSEELIASEVSRGRYMSKQQDETVYSSKLRSLTISDIARMANVGVATVSRVLNNSPKVSPKTTERVRKILEKTNYRPAYAARALAQGRTNTIELLYNTTAEKLSDDPVLLNILDAVHAEIKRADYRLAFSAIKTEFSDVPLSFMQTMEHRVADAALIVSVKMTDQSLRRLQGLPVVILDYDGKGIVSSVVIKNQESMFDAVTKIAGIGHRRIAFLWTGLENHNEQERYKGYVEGMAKAGLQRRPEYEISANNLHDGLHRAMAMDEPPTAIISTYTTDLPHLFRLFDETGVLIPRDISLITVDAAPESVPAITGLLRPVSSYVLEWDSIVKVAIAEVIATAKGTAAIHNLELTLPFYDKGTLAPPK
jgi:LacI family transcriptional regulator